jgi:hypothetical protein
MELTDLALGVQGMIARVTVDAAPGTWAPEYSWSSNPSQRDFSSVRYQLAFMGYGVAAAAAAATPAHTGAASAILNDIIVRMLDPAVWGIARTSDWPNTTFNPADPVAYQNVMYSGHLALLLVLYEGLTGNDKFAHAGFTFASFEGGAPAHYTTDSLVQVLADQTATAPCGGIPCEPFQVFTVCNQHSEAAKRGLVALRGSHSKTGEVAGSSRFLTFLRDNGTFPAGESQWLRAVYVQAQSQFPSNSPLPKVAAWAEGWWSRLSPNAGGWMPGFDAALGVASDAWTGAWMGMWTDEATSQEFVCNDGVRKLLANPAWHAAGNGSHLAAPKGSCFATVLATQAIALCPSLANGTERANAAQAYLQSHWGVWLPGDAYFLNTTGCDHRFGHPLLNTGAMLVGISGGALPLRQLLLDPPPPHQQLHRLLEVQVDDSASGAWSVAVPAAHADGRHLNFTLAGRGSLAAGDDGGSTAGTVTAVCELAASSAVVGSEAPHVTIVGWPHFRLTPSSWNATLGGGGRLNITLPGYVLHQQHDRRVRVVVNYG